MIWTKDELALIVAECVTSLIEKRDLRYAVRSKTAGRISDDVLWEAVDYAVECGLITRRVSDFDGLTTFRPVR